MIVIVHAKRIFKFRKMPCGFLLIMLLIFHLSIFVHFKINIHNFENTNLSGITVNVYPYSFALLATADLFSV